LVAGINDDPLRAERAKHELSIDRRRTVKLMDLPA
jgi:hypothetical protein